MITKMFKVRELANFKTIRCIPLERFECHDLCECIAQDRKGMYWKFHIMSPNSVMYGLESLYIGENDTSGYDDDKIMCVAMNKVREIKKIVKFYPVELQCRKILIKEVVT